MGKKKTQKQREFDLVLNYSGDKVDFTKKIKIEDIDIIRNNQDKIEWGVLANRSLTDEIINEFWDKLEPYLFIDRNPYNLNFDILKACKRVIRWYTVIDKIHPSRITLKFHKEFEKEIGDYYIGTIINRNKNSINEIPEETLDYVLYENKNENVINSLSSQKSISLKTIERYKDILNWKYLSTYSTELHDEKVFNKYKNYIDISEYASLKEQSSYYGITDSGMIKRLNSVLTEKFLLEHKDEISWYQIINWVNYHSGRMLVNKFNRDKLNIVPTDFFIKHRDELPMDEISKLIKDFNENKDITLKYFIVPNKNIIASYFWKI